MTGHAAVTRCALLAQFAFKRTDQVERVIGNYHVLIPRAGELALAHLLELAKQRPNVGGIARGGAFTCGQARGRILIRKRVESECKPGLEAAGGVGGAEGEL